MPLNLSLMSLPDEILLEIFLFFPKHLLLRLRCVSRAFALLATPGAFRSLRLRAYRDEPQRFIQIATSEKLRSHIREVTCDTWCDPEVNRRAVWDLLAVQVYSDFLDALPYIASFRNLEAFHLRFGTCLEEARIIRITVTGRVFPYLAGISLEQSIGRKGRPFHRLDRPLQLKTLTISNLDESINKKLVKSEAFQAIISSSYLVDLRLYLATDTWGLIQSSSNKCSDQSDMFESLPYTWLRPSIATNLRLLSLYCHEPWGWFPKMDFRLVGAGDGMPNLKVLALGNYTFSHEWQVEWVGSLGIEKLYLDGCAILFQASKRRGILLDQSETVIQDSDGRVHTFSNSGYYVKSEIPRSGDVASAIYGTLCWHHLLSHWAQSMTNLRVFKMGKGHWDDIPNEAIDPSYHERLHMASSQEAASQAFTHHGFRLFEYPSPGTTGSGIQKYGTGASGDDEDMLKYAYWMEEYTDYDEVWKRREDERKVMAEEEWYGKYGQDGRRKLTDEDRAIDKAALEAMISAVDTRRAHMNTPGTGWEA
ncbi:F-box domain-containing protein [Fusarium sp. LHS14.1]|nr:F-box domain-containing protein [Fusarium sp. LHS14.1]